MARTLDLRAPADPKPEPCFIRFAVGPIFLVEGLQKFLFPAALGVGRFVKIGIPWPHLTAPFVGNVEVIAGLFLILGLWTRLAAFALLVDIAVALVTTKIPMLLHEGFWKAAHESRTDWAMFFGLLFILIAGAGSFSLDAARRR